MPWKEIQRNYGLNATSKPRGPGKLYIKKANR